MDSNVRGARGRAASLLATVLVAVLLFGSYNLGTLQGESGKALEGLAAASKAPVTLASDIGNARVESERGLFSQLAKRLMPTVVHIKVTTRGEAIGPSPFGEMPEEFRRFFGPHPFPQGLPRESQGQGSGVIISRDGYILTNDHVVRGATEILVTLADGRELKARRVGTDPKTDLAVIRVDSPASLPVAELGDSDAAQVGDWVMAIGNPFGLSHTVTVGVISGKGRVIGMDSYDQFLQTDASINPGNSGGPLFDTEGRVVGINTAIISQGQGIGFAVPANLARQVADQLRTNGEVIRGFLGLGIQPVTEREIQALGLPEGSTGALVSSVVPGGPGDRAGVRVGDVVTEFNGHKLADDRALLNAVAAAPVGSKATVTLFREGRPRALSLTVARRPSDDGQIGRAEAPEAAAPGGLGLAVQDLDSSRARQLGLPFAEGVVVTDVQPGSPADQAGLRPGDVVRQVGARPVKGARDFQKLVQEGRVVALLVVRDGRQSFVVLERDAG